MSFQKGLHLSEGEGGLSIHVQVPCQEFVLCRHKAAILFTRLAPVLYEETLTPAQMNSVKKQTEVTMA